MSIEDDLKAILNRERKARKQAELLLEEKSLELYVSNQQLRELNVTLEERISLRTKELEKAKNKAEQADANKTEFLSKVSHELRTPLNAIAGFTQLLSKKGLEGESAEFLKAIQVSSNELIATVNDVLDWSKIEAGEISVQLDTLKIYSFVDDISSTFRGALQEKKVELVVTIDSKIPEHILADKLKLTQILNNLIGNATKFTTKGKIEVSIKIEVPKDNSETMLLFSVVDSGKGIQKNELETVFERFKQAQHDVINQNGGTGLGLAITKKLVLLLGGTIGIRSEVGVGSEFYFTLPLKTPKTKIVTKFSESDAFESSDGNLKGVTVLIVDDLPMNIKLLEYTLLSLGCSILIAENGKQAVEMALSEKPEIILMDLQMPIMTGTEATFEIRKLGIQTPIIALTADAFPQTKEKVLLSGMNDFISKPIDIQVLKQKMRQHLKLA